MKATGRYPGLAAAGETMQAVQRFLAAMGPAEPLASLTPLSLDSITDYSGGYQFAGDGTVAHPNLWNADLVNFDPFQVAQHKWVIPTYVTTLDLATLYNPSAPASDVGRQDMPPALFDLTIGGVNPATASASMSDPITGASSPLGIVARGADSVTVRVPETDYPRMLTLSDS